MTDHALLLSSVASAALVFLLSMLFVRWRRDGWWYGLCGAVALMALALPLAALTNALGAADTKPPAGSFPLIGWKIDEHAGLVYLYVRQDDAGDPYLMALPFDYDSALGLHETAKLVGPLGKLQVTISHADSGAPVMLVAAGAGR